MKKLALIFLVIPLTACGYDIYQKPGATQSQFAWDQTVCRNYALAQPVAAVPEHQNVGTIAWPEDRSNQIKESKDFRSCMTGKGYRYEHTMSPRTIGDQRSS